MNADLLLTLYDRVADAPDAIARLRRFVLDLAVRGKLVEQDAPDKTAVELLKRIQRARRKRVANGEMRPEKRIPAPARDAEIFRLSPNWLWCVADSVWDFENGDRSTNYPSRDQLVSSGVPFINAGHLVKGRVSSKQMNFITHEKFESLGGGKLRQGDQLYCLRGSLGKHAVFDTEMDAAIASSLVILRPVLADCVPYFSLYLDSSVAEIMLRRFDNGSAQPNLSSANLRRFEIPLPPLAEQHRIVAKVDELMALCDRLEKARAAREETRDWLTKASLARLSTPDTDDVTFRSYARFAVDALPALTARADQVKHLRETILNLAVRGKLVEQDPAAELLKRITAEKARLVKTGKIRKPRAVVPLDSDGFSFPLPRGWAWTQIVQLGVINPRNKAPDDHEASFVPMPMIPTEYGVTNAHEARPWGKIKKGYTHFAEGDVGLAKITPCFENGKSVVFRNLTGGIGSGTTELHVIRPIFVVADCIVLFLKGPHFIKTGIPRMTGTAGQKRVPTEYFTSSSFPLPPLAEQRRIVTKVDELMALCDRLEASLVAAGTTRYNLLESLLQEAFAPSADNDPAGASPVSISRINPEAVAKPPPARPQPQI